MRSRNSIRDFALAAFVVAGIAIMQAGPQVIPASHALGFGSNNFGGPGVGLANFSPNGIAPAGVLGKTRFVSIDGGGQTSIAISASGLISTWGISQNGGLGYTVVGNSQPFPKQVFLTPGRAGISVSAGFEHMLAVLDDGSLWSWGSTNFAGQLGRTGSNSFPQAVPGLSDMRKVAAGSDYSLAIDVTGHLFGWGANLSGQLGKPGTFTQPEPIDSPAFQDIAAGPRHAVAIATDGSVWAWGSNQYGQAGQDPATAGQSIGITQVPGLANIVAIAAGDSSSYALASDGSLWAWGRENELGIGSTSGLASPIPRQVMLMPSQPLTGVTGVASGLHYGVASLEDGRYVYWSATSALSLGLSNSASSAPFATVGPPAGASIAGVAAGDMHGFLLVGDPPITSSWQIGTSMTCGANNTATVSLNGYSLAGLGLTDVMLVIDESGSMSATEFAQLKSFATNFVNQLDMNTTRVGLVMFSSTARLILAPTGNRTQILGAINGVTQALGYTCIGCGLNEADEALDATERGAARYVVVVTDGVNNVPSQGSPSAQQQFLQQAVNNAHQKNKVLSVGVGDQIDAAELAFVASDIPGFTTVFTASDFTVLDELVVGLVRAVILSPGATNAHLDVDLGPSWNVVSGTPSVAGSTFTKNSNSSFSWVLPTLDTAGATLQLVLNIISGGGDLRVPSSEVYADDQNNAFVPAVQRGVLVSGCPSTFTLSPATSSAAVNTQHVVTATLLDNVGNPLVNAPVRFKFVAGPRSGATIITATTNTFGVVSAQFTSASVSTDVVQATLVSNPNFVSNTASHTWLPPNAPPIANAGPDQTITLSGTSTAPVTLNASASTDDGQRQPLEYSWASDTGIVTAGEVATVSLPFGTHTFTLGVSDGEFTRTDTVVIIVNDVTPPVVTADVAGTLGQNGWYVSDVSVSYSFDDPESGIASTNNCQPQALVSDTLGQTFTCDVTNGAGITASSSQTLRRDATRPVIDPKSDLTGLATSPQGANAPYSPPGAHDATSGLLQSFALCVPPSGSLFPIGTTLVTCTATDAAGNTESSTFNIIVNDPTPPVILPVVAGALGNGGWYRGDVLVSWNVDDPDSGVGSSNGCDATTISADTASTTFTCTATNNAGVSNAVSTTIMRDATAPVVSTPASFFASAATSAGSIVNYAAATAADELSGVAGAVVCAPASGSQFPIGTTQVTCSVDDAAGNTGSASFDITVGDTTPPSISSSVTGTPGSNGWFTSPVQIVWTVNDPQSSVSTTGCDPVTLSADTPGVTITCGATSAGGSSSASEAVKIDRDAPLLTTPGAVSATATSLSGSNVPYSVSASDATSGLAGAVSCAPASGSLFAIGTTTVTCTASDNAGHSANASFTVTVDLSSNEPGKMHGNGHVVVVDTRVQFDFDVEETAKKGEKGRVDIHIERGHNGKFDDERFEAGSVTDVVFSNAPGYVPGKDPKSGIDTVIFSGTGRWDKQDGYTYVATASDRGEPGRAVDTFIIEVKAPSGQIVFAGGGVIADGNVQSNKK